ncbi:MAG TPA: ABC transporter substrate-binding protein [Longilinea sp.]|nr:ABC transporter substrate-binding protein [Longilinea sp.]
MKRIPFSTLLSLLVALSFVLTACEAGEGITLIEQAEDFVPESISAENCDYGGLLRSVEAIDQYTVRFTLCEPDPLFSARLSYPAFSILDEDYLNQYGGDSFQMTNDVNGTGPYIVDQYEPGDSLRMSSNPSYWGTPPKVDSIILSWESNPFHRFTALNFYLADLIDNPSPINFNQIENAPELQLSIRNQTTSYYLGFNHNIAPFDNQEVRMALAQGVDRQDIVATYFPAGSTVADQFIPSSFPIGNSVNLSWYEYDSMYARSILDAAGFDFSQELVLYYEDVSTTIISNPEDIVSALRIDFSLMGVDLRGEALPSAQFNARLAAGELGFFLTSTTAGFPDAASLFSVFTGSNHQFGDIVPELQAAIYGGQETNVEASRQVQYHAANQLIYERALLIPLAYTSTALANRQSVDNVVAGPYNDNIPEMGNLADVLTIEQTNEPVSLWPGDEIDVDTMRVARLLYDTLTRVEYGGTSILPSLSDYWVVNSDYTEWTFDLHYDVLYSNGASFDANDVVATFSALWDAANPNHVGRTGQFEAFQLYMGNFLNAP